MTSLQPTRALRVVMLGAPGSGKGTHARLLAEHFSVPHLSTGAMLRREISAGTAVGSEVAAAVEAGELVDDALIADLVGRAVSSNDARHGWILDGAPRSVAQAELIAPCLESSGSGPVIAILLDVPEPELQRRLTERAAREGRADDAPEVVARRFDVWGVTGPPLIDWFAQRTIVHRIDGTGSADDVARRVVDEVQRVVGPPTDTSPD
jgi:adenylate kinase